MSQETNRLVIIGAGGHAKVCYDIAKLMNVWNEFIFLDDNLDNKYFDITGSIQKFKEYTTTSDFFVALGDNFNRMKITEKLLENDVNSIKLLHPNAIVSQDVKIGSGTVIMAGVVINANVKIGHSCIINTSASVDHDSIIGDFSHISPGVNLAGEVSVGKKTWIGIGSQVIQRVKIGDNTIVGAGSTVLENVKSNSLAVGSPARVIKSNI